MQGPLSNSVVQYCMIFFGELRSFFPRNNLKDSSPEVFLKIKNLKNKYMHRDMYMPIHVPCSYEGTCFYTKISTPAEIFWWKYSKYLSTRKSFRGCIYGEKTFRQSEDLG